MESMEGGMWKVIYLIYLLLLHLPLRGLCLLQGIHEGTMLVRLTHRMKRGHDVLQPR